MRPAWRAENSPRNPHAACSSPPSCSVGADTRGEHIPRTLADEDGSWTRADPTSRPALVAASHRPPPAASDKAVHLASDMTARQRLGGHMDQRSPASASVTNSQESAATTSTDQIVTPPPSDTSAGLDGSAPTEVCGGNDGAKEAAAIRGNADESTIDVASQLHRLSAVAAIQHRMVPDEAGSGWSRKRMADGVVKARDGSASPTKGHSRNTSAVSAASTTGSNMGQVRPQSPILSSPKPC